MAQTVYDHGDPITSRLTLGVTPDGTTTVSVQWLLPSGGTTAGTVVGPISGDQYTSQQLTGVTGPGDYVAVWTVAGTGAGVQTKVYNVRRLPGSAPDRAAWVPFLSDVADHVPRLTVDTVTPGSAIEYGTFTGTTSPTDEQVQRLIDAAAATLAATVGTVDTALYGLARAVTALRAAAAVQRAYPRDPSDLNTASQLDARAEAELKRLITANTAAGQASVPAAVSPYWSFPPAVAWGDSYL